MSIKQKISKCKELALNEYYTHIRIIFNIQGYDLGLNEPLYYKEQAIMVSRIKSIMGDYPLTDVYIF